jgi:transcriptional regulator with PAS, ATPase and Fis domain
LRDRIDDVIPLTCFLIQQHGDKDNLPQLAPDVCAILESYTWPGNCKELQNTVKHALENVKDGIITKDSLPQNIADTPVVKTRRQDDDADSVKGKSLKAFLSKKKQEYLQQFTKG